MESWVYGIIFTFIAAFGSTTGLILQKIAHRVEQSKEEQGIPQPKWNGIPCNKYFLCGFIFLALIPLPFEFLALMYAGQSIILPTGTGCTVVFGQLIAPAVLGEKLTKLDLLATLLISIGVVVSIAFGTHVTPHYSAEELMLLFTETAFIASLVTTTMLTIACLTIFHIEKLYVRVPAPARIPLLAFVPSAIGAIQITCFKVLSELTKNTFTGKLVTVTTNATGTVVSSQSYERTNEFLKPSLYLYLFLVIVLAIQQLSYLNRGLARHTAIKFLPTYNTLLLMVGVANGAIFFKEYTAFHPVFFPIGCLLEITGILALSWKAKKPEESDAKSISARPIEIIDSKSDKGADEDNVELRTIPNPLQS